MDTQILPLGSLLLDHSCNKYCDLIGQEEASICPIDTYKVHSLEHEAKPTRKWKQTMITHTPLVASNLPIKTLVAMAMANKYYYTQPQAYTCSTVCSDIA